MNGPTVYDFSALSSYEFELLSADLLGRELGVHLEVFSAGRDGGIDLRHIDSNGKTLVVQCKHWAKSGLTRLLRELEQVELPKVVRQRPDVYLISTSVPMTSENKKTIYSMFKGFMATPQGVYGKEDLNTLLRRYPEVEKSHFKLWLSGTAVLERILHSDIHNATEHKVEDIQQRIALYVPTKAYPAALERLERDHVCIVAGIPGIGKTMLADMLLYTSVGQGFQPVVLRHDVAEADSVYKTDAPQVFLYDDFLGQTTSTEKLQKNEDSRLVSFIDRVTRNEHKRFILTTREYILQQARASYERLNAPEFDTLKYVLTLDQYSRFDKAKILYNHLYFSELARETQLQLVTGRAYTDIIDHRNYNPRLVQYVIKLAVGQERTNNLVRYFKETLDQPEQLWRHAVENQLGASERAALFALCMLPPEVRLQELTPVVSSIRAPTEARAEVRETREALRILEDTFVRIGRMASGPTVSFHNPSIRDFLLGELDRDTSILANLVTSATSFEQIRLLHGYGVGPHWSGEGNRAFEGIRSWFEANGRFATQRLIDLFESPGGTYVSMSDGRGGRKDLRPSRSLEARLAFVINFSISSQFDLTKWLPEALAIIAEQWRLHIGNREDWAEVVGSARDRYQGQLIDTSREAHDWFFEEMMGGDDFEAYLAIAAHDAWWLRPDHQELARERFDWFAEYQLDWIVHEAEDLQEGRHVLDSVTWLAENFGVELEPKDLLRAEEALLRLPDRDDQPGDYSGRSRPGGFDFDGDIDEMFRSL